MKYVKSFPSYAVFDGVDLFGAKLYHTSLRRYKVFVKDKNHPKFVCSFSLHEKY